jgi:hypothetical protein
MSRPVSYDLSTNFSGQNEITTTASIGGQAEDTYVLTPQNVAIDTLSFTAFSPTNGPKYVRLILQEK